MSNVASAPPSREAVRRAGTPVNGVPLHGAEALPFRQVRDLSATISTGFAYIRMHWRTLYRPLFFICLPVKIIASVLLGSFFHDFRPGRMPGSSSFWSMFGGYALMALSYIVAAVVISEYMGWTMRHPDRRPTLGEVWRETRRNLLFYVGLSLVTAAMTFMGFFILILPFFFLLIVFQFSYPLHAFERADFGECIGRAFTLVWGRWWMTFALFFVLLFMSIFLNLVIDIPGWIITGFGWLSGMGSMYEDPSEASARLRWFFTLFALIGNVSSLLLMPFVQVPMCFHMLSTLEKKEAPGLLAEVERFNLDARD